MEGSGRKRCSRAWMRFSQKPVQTPMLMYFTAPDPLLVASKGRPKTLPQDSIGVGIPFALHSASVPIHSFQSCAEIPQAAAAESGREGSTL